MTAPRIYMAGKIGAHDWRHKLIPGLRDDSSRLFDPDFTLDCRSFRYGGPFFVSCDHGCYHGPANHGAGIIDDGCGDEWGNLSAEHSAHTLQARRRAIFAINRERVLRADHVFAFIESPDCYGTLVELGLASAKGIPIAIGFAPGVCLADRDELWMAAQTARFVWHDTAEDSWRQFERALPLYR
jgi:hypothetical protein